MGCEVPTVLERIVGEAASSKFCQPSTGDGKVMSAAQPLESGGVRVGAQCQ